MTAAFEETLRELEVLDHSDPLTEIVAKKIIEGARLGVCDPIRLRELAVARFPQRKNSAVPRTRAETQSALAATISARNRSLRVCERQLRKIPEKPSSTPFSNADTTVSWT